LNKNDSPRMKCCTGKHGLRLYRPLRHRQVQLGEYLARGASSCTSSTLFDYLNNYTTTFVVDIVRHEELLQLHLRRHAFGSRGFLVYLGNVNIDLVDIDFRLCLRRLLHGVDRTSAHGASPATLSTSTFDLTFGIYYIDANWAVAQGASPSTSPTPTPASFHQHVLRRMHRTGPGPSSQSPDKRG
jgi:hypothetical protein